MALNVRKNARVARLPDRPARPALRLHLHFALRRASLCVWWSTLTNGFFPSTVGIHFFFFLLPNTPLHLFSFHFITPNIFSHHVLYPHFATHSLIKRRERNIQNFGQKKKKRTGNLRGHSSLSYYYYYYYDDDDDDEKDGRHL